MRIVSITCSSKVGTSFVSATADLSHEDDGVPAHLALIQLELKVAVTKSSIVNALLTGDLSSAQAKEKLDLLDKNAESMRRTLALNRNTE